MEDLAAGVTPAMDSTPAADPFVQQLLTDKADLEQRLKESEEQRAALERRLALYMTAYNERTQLPGSKQKPGLMAVLYKQVYDEIAESRTESPLSNASKVNDLIALRAAANQIVAQIKPKDFPGAAINWGDLGCRAAYLGVDEQGNVHNLVIIDEASPAEYPFCQYVADQLAAQGWPDVEVATEW